MATNLSERYLDRPAANKPAENVERISIEIGRQKGLRLEFTGDVANQHIAYRYTAAGMMPDSGGGEDVDQSLVTTIPAGDFEAAPRGLATGEALSQARLAFPDDARTAVSPRFPRWRRIEQPCVETQPGDHTYPLTNRLEELNGSETAVGNPDNAPIGKPPCQLKQHLSGPIGELLMLQLVLAR